MVSTPLHPIALSSPPLILIRLLTFLASEICTVSILNLQKLMVIATPWQLTLTAVLVFQSHCLSKASETLKCQTVTEPKSSDRPIPTFECFCKEKKLNPSIHTKD